MLLAVYIGAAHLSCNFGLDPTGSIAALVFHVVQARRGCQKEIGMMLSKVSLPGAGSGRQSEFRAILCTNEAASACAVLMSQKN